MSTQTGVAARRVAIKALVRIEQDEAYANLVLGPMLERSGLSDRDRAFVTELVYGTTRMLRSCDFLVERYLMSKIDHQVRAALRLGAYQLRFLDTAPHAAVGATVGAVDGPGRGVVNAVLRKLGYEAERGEFPEWPNEATRLSYPTWILKKLTADLGEDTALEVLEEMNHAATVTRRDDGYIQDEASQRVGRLVGARPGDVVLDLCSAPGGKSTAIASSDVFVVAADLQHHRAKLVKDNVERLGSNVSVLVADGLLPAIKPSSVDRILIDAPCSGLGSLRRRADARWRIDAKAPERLRELQASLVVKALDLLKPGGVLTYSVCTLTTEEGPEVLAKVRAEFPDLEVLDPFASETDAGEAVSAPWRVTDGVGYLLPAGTDGMMLWQVLKPS